MTTVAVVQARYGSKRFPGKVMQVIDGYPAIYGMLKRCHFISGVDRIVCAIPDTSENNDIATWAEEAEVEVFRGSENDVLGRTLGAAQMCGADIVMRVTSDCPLIEPFICSNVLEFFNRNRPFDYVSNVYPRRTYPKGLDCEVFSISSLIMADRSTKERYDREHVTPWMRRRESGLHTGFISYGGDQSDKRWTLDYPEDLEFFRAVFAHGEPWTMEEVLSILDRHPEIEKINMGVGR